MNKCHEQNMNNHPHHDSAKSEALLARRRRAEMRFRLYGRIAVLLAMGSLVLLLVNLLLRSYFGFYQAQIELELDFETVAESQLNPDNINYRKIIRASLRQYFPDVTARRDRKELYSLLSGGAEFELRDAVAANPDILEKRKGSGSGVKLWFTAADAVDLYMKGRVDTNLPQHKRRLSDQQLRWLEKLQVAGQLELKFSSRFFTAADSREPEQAGFAGSIIGSLLTMLVCLLVAFPLGVMTAVYLEEFAGKNWLTNIVEVNINNLAAVPSIIFGLLGLAVYLNLFGMPRAAPLVGGMTLALMILPVIIITTRASLGAIPDSIRQGAAALGASRLQVVLHHVLPLALPGIMTGTILGLARAIGETAPLLMIGMVAFIADVPTKFTDSATVMPVQIFLWASSPEQSFVEKTAAGIIVLLAILILMNSLAIWIRKRYETRW